MSVERLVCCTDEELVMRKIFTDFPIGGTFELSADDAHHVLVVLRHTVGDMIQVTDCTGATYECLITRMAGHSAFLTPTHKISEKKAYERDRYFSCRHSEK